MPLLATLHPLTPNCLPSHPGSSTRASWLALRPLLPLAAEAPSPRSHVPAFRAQYPGALQPALGAEVGPGQGEAGPGHPIPLGARGPCQ